jgi:hypothetical protein
MTKRHPFKFENPEQLEAARALSKYVVHVLHSNGFHGRVGVVTNNSVYIHISPTRVRPFFLFLPPKFIRAPERWRLYYRGTDTNYPLMIKISGRRENKIPESPFVINLLEVSYVQPPSIL